MSKPPLPTSIIEDNSRQWSEIFHLFKEPGGSIRQYAMDTVVSWVMSYARPKGSDWSVLDVGCGSAPNMLFFLEQGFQFTGIDVTDVPFPNLGGLPRNLLSNILLQTFSPPEFPFGDEEFSHLISTEALHLNATEESMRKAIHECWRVLRPSGRGLITTITPEHWLGAS
ncbi:class I SAM-dependent methyltransferase [Alphaproteobacteria bacterium]|nr:class I SAM-dependent methyltransferase [Alphaproteobacteria bacterium]